MIAVTIREWIETLRSVGRREVRPGFAADKTILKESTDLETLLFFIILIFLIAVLSNHTGFVKSDYGSPSGRSFAGTLVDKGTGGEFMIYSHLEKLGEPNRLLPHLHLPKSDGTTIEIDLVMIARTGIYVFESKNFSGCIFGDEDSRYWTQTMKRGPKHEFYNPIWQNESRISSLKRQLALETDAFKSYVVFSDRCTLKKMYVQSSHVKVVNRHLIVREIIKDMAELPDIFTPLEINQIYSELVPYTRTAAAIGQARIETMRLE
jgi:hypothetical protein